MEPQQFVKKPVIVEAIEFTDENKNRVFNWITCNRYPRTDEHGNATLVIETFEGDYLVRLGDWIIKGIKGEFYPCKPDIFKASYELCKDKQNQ